MIVCLFAPKDATIDTEYLYAFKTHTCSPSIDKTLFLMDEYQNELLMWNENQHQENSQVH